MNRGKGPWYVSLIASDDDSYALCCHTYARQYASLLNGVGSQNCWKTRIVVGPFSYLMEAEKFLAENVDEGSCRESFARYGVNLWDIVSAKTKKRKPAGNRLTLEMLDGKLTIGIIRLMQSKRRK